jgi:hypothetical protein
MAQAGFRVMDSDIHVIDRAEVPWVTRLDSAGVSS